LIKTRVNSKDFAKKMNNIVNYSVGFIDGSKNGLPSFLVTLGEQTTDLLGQYIDASARSNPQFLHHVYEWYMVGSPNARLFDIKYVPSKNMVSFFYTFKQSQSIKDGSREAFYDKARIMEEGSTVIIEPRTRSFLAFEDDGELVFTSDTVVVDNPGGSTEGEFAKIFDQFFTKYFTQAFLKSSGLLRHLEIPTEFVAGIREGSKVGKSAGVKAGFKWITNAKVGVE
jgi:hypothetical protein